MSKAWYESNRTAGAYYSEEGVECVKGVGKKAEGLKSHGIKTVGDLWVVVDDVVKRVNTINSIRGLGKATMEKNLIETSNTLTGSPPPHQSS
mmetsp:Transcript_32603/g.68426  ORF Transcript_32603/g.68426 Transcript_32603/m.68426 type:complete len:92 (-) Transcript_32603:544-819(-)